MAETVQSTIQITVPLLTLETPERNAYMAEGNWLVFIDKNPDPEGGASSQVFFKRTPLDGEPTGLCRQYAPKDIDPNTIEAYKMDPELIQSYINGVQTPEAVNALMNWSYECYY